MRPIFRLISTLVVCAWIALLSPSAHAATPSEGTLRAPSRVAPGAHSDLAYAGAPIASATYAGGNDAICAQDPAPPLECDVFTLHLAIPSSFWSTYAARVNGRLSATIDWSATPGADLDVMIEKDGQELAINQEDNFQGVPHTTVEVPNPDAGTYQIVVMGGLGSVPTYSGIARLLLTTPTSLNTVNSSAVRFGPASVVSP
ncbi:MAG: hypothetical protein LC663_05890, partial [Actinobacteria bacterium]|nr:hypothetical protein [Actinomycetota bacterium]